jgi:spore germination protein KB
MRNLSKHQLFSLMFVFEVGSTTLFALGIKAEQDAWLVILVALLIGVVFIWFYTELQMIFPKKNYAEIILVILGKPLGIPLALLYAVYWLWPAARNLREFGEMIVITALPKTPLVYILIVFVLVSLYGLVKGVEVMGRTSEIVAPIIIIFMIIVYVLIYASGEVEFENLKPFLGEGLKPVIKAAYPNVAIFPFGEIFVFSMYWCYAKDAKFVRKTTLLVAITSGILLSLSLTMDIAVLGVKYTSIASIPLLEVIRLINIGKLLSNIDTIGIMIIFLGGFYKMSLFLNGISLIIVTVFKIKNYTRTLIILSIFLVWVAIVFEPSYAYHQWMTPFDTNYFYITFLHIIPVLLLFIYWIKNKRMKQ